MIDPTVPISRAIAIVSWVIGSGFFVAGWAVYLIGLADLGVMLTVSSLPFAAVSGVLMVRCWSARVCQVVRNTSGGGDHGPGVVPLK